MNFSQSGSPCSSSPSSPAVQMRPSSLHGLGSKLGTQRYAKVGRRKSTSNIPPSPLACTSSPQALSPQHSSSPLPSITKTLHSYHGKTLSPPTIVRQGVRPRSTEIPVSPLLKRVQSAEKLSGVFHGDKKAHGPRRHTLEVPHCELDVGGDAEMESQYGSIDHGRLGGFSAGQIVVMRKLNLSERRDSFKKQEAVQEVSFDEPDERAGQTPATPTVPVDAQPKHRAEWAVPNLQSREECVVRRVPLVPQIAVQGSESEELEDWQPCSDEEAEGKNTGGSLDSCPEDKRPESACSSSISSDSSSVASKSKGQVTDTEEATSMSPKKGRVCGK